MPTAVRPSELERRKSVRIRMRPNLVYSAQRYEGRSYFVVKDPVTLSWYRLDEGQHFAAGLLDGRHTLGDIQKAYEEKFRPERLTLEELEAFAAGLLDSGLAQNESPQAGQLLHERSRKHRRAVRWATLLNFLAIKVPLLDPDRLLGRLVPRLGFLFSTGGVLAGLALVLVALGLVATRWDDFLTRLPAHQEFFTARTLVYLWLAIGLSRVLHELGHGLCCKRQGGEIHEAGVLILVFFPALYCNVSDSWSLPSKWRRMAVAAAGIYVDLLIAAVATLLWWGSVPNTPVHNLSFALALACTGGTLVWNANPLLRFDGYYVLSDWLEVPNLAEQSSRFLQAACLRWLGFPVPAEPVPSRRRPGLFVLYAAASYAYRVVVTAAILYFLFTFLKPYKLGAIGYILGLIALVVMVVRPAWSLARAALTHGRLSEMIPARLWLAVGMVLLVVALFVLAPYPLHVEGQALFEVDPDHVRRVVVPDTGGFLKELRVRDGQRVRAGEVLAVLVNPKLEARLRVNEVDQALRSQQRTSQLAELAEREPAGEAAGNLQQIEFELRTLLREHAALRESNERLILRVPRDGVVLGLVPPETKGKWLEKGTELCRVGDPRALRAVLLVAPEDHRLVRPGARASVRAHGLGLAEWDGAVVEIAQVDAPRVPAPLSSRAGGEVATEQNSSGEDRPRAPHYLASIRLPDLGESVQPGVLGRVKVEGPGRTSWWRLSRYLAKTFDWGL